MGKIKIDQADKYFSWWVRCRDNWSCKRCGKHYTPPTTSLQCSHFKGRGKEGTRFEPLNADSLCYGCHMYFTAQPDEHYAWQVQQKGQDVVDQLTLQANAYHRKNRLEEKLKWKERLLKDFGVLL